MTSLARGTPGDGSAGTPRGRAPRILELRGRLAAALGDAPAARRTRREGLDLYRAIGATGHAERLATELGQSFA